jgi:hypothetical protein
MKTILRRVVNPTCAECEHEFTDGELRYRADDGKDYCKNGCGQRQWAIEQGVAS